MAQEIQNLEKSLISVKEFISKSYMQQFASANCSVAVIQNESKAKSKIRMLRIDQLVLSDERVEERMETIFQALNPLVKSCFLLYQGKNGKISLYIGFRSDVPSTAESTLIQVLKGNFPGIKYERLEANRIEQILGRLESTPDSLQTVASLSVVPSERRQDGEKSQGFEKFLNSMDGHDFSALILSTPYGDKEIQHRILALEQISTSLSSLESVTLQNTSSQSLTLTESAAQAVSASINESLSEAYTQGSSIGSFSSSGNGYGFGGANNFGAPTLSANRNYQTGFGQTQTSSSSLTDTRTYGTSIGKTTTNGLAFGITGGQSVALSRTQTNMEIQNLKKRIDDQIERLQKSQAQGLWNCQGYFVSERNDTVYAAANSFRSLVMGDQTNVDASEMVFWQPTPPQSRVSNHKGSL